MEIGCSAPAVQRNLYWGWHRIWLVGIVLVLASIFAWGEKRATEETSELHFLVLRQENGKPVRNASVVLHPLDNKEKQGVSGFQLKTSSEGEASIDGIPYGKLRVQVIAPGLQTFGQDYEIRQPTVEFKIELKPPQPQISIY